MSLRLQADFGLRRGESIKIRPEWDDRGDRLALKDTRTKGGQPREIPIRNAEQRQVLDEAKALAGRCSLIPTERSYVEQVLRFDYQCAAAGAHRIHGHRHQYAQIRYRELTGWPAPAAGGPRSRNLAPSQREVDRGARLTISEEVGHEREQITAVYLGRWPPAWLTGRPRSSPRHRPPCAPALSGSAAGTAQAVRTGRLH